VLLVGFTHSDTEEQGRLDGRQGPSGSASFPTTRAKMNRAIDGGGRRDARPSRSSTLYGDANKGSPARASSTPRGPEAAIPLYERFRRAAPPPRNVRVENGRGSAADMQVELVNDGPVTLHLERLTNPHVILASQSPRRARGCSRSSASPTRSGRRTIDEIVSPRARRRGGARRASGRAGKGGGAIEARP